MTVPRSSTLTRRMSCLLCLSEPLKRNSQPGGQSCRFHSLSSAVVLLAGEMGETRGTRREKQSSNMGKIAIILHLFFLLWDMRNGEHWGLWVGGKCLYLVAKASQSESPWKECRRRSCDALSRKLENYLTHQVLLHWRTRRTEDAEQPTESLLPCEAGEEHFIVGGSLSCQSHLQKLQRCLLKWVLSPSLQPSTCSTNKGNVSNKKPQLWQT